MKRKIYTFIFLIGALFVFIIGGFIYTYYPSKFVHDGYSMYEAKQKTYSIMAVFGAVTLAIYYLTRLLGIHKWYKGQPNEEKPPNEKKDSDDSK